MSDRDEAPDPIDWAYVQAGALEDDAGARAARRAGVLAAVARETAAPATAAVPPAPDRAWRRGGWLAAACVTGLGLFLASQIQTPPAPPASAPPPPLAAPSAAAVPLGPKPAAPRRIVAPAHAAPRRSAPRAFPEAAETGARGPAPAPVAAPIVTAPMVQPFAAPPPPPPPPPPPAAEPYGTSGLMGSTADQVVVAKGPAAPTALSQSENGYSAAVVVPAARVARVAGRPAEPGAELRAAAVAGRADAVKDMLIKGVPVDATDPAGDTALIQSVRAGRLAVVALLIRHGASLDHKNQAGESARTLAAAKGDEKLNRALGLAP